MSETVLKPHWINDVPVQKVVEQFGDPLYLYNADVLESQASYLKEQLPDKLHVFYSLKANPNFHIVKAITKNIDGAEVSSAIELKTALDAGVSADNIVFVGPGKTDEDLTLALDAGVTAIVVESISEIEDLQRHCEQSDSTASILFRINPDFNVKGSKLTMTGVSSQFGIDSEDVDKAFQVAEQADRVNVVGIHIYIGTRILESKYFYENTQRILQLADDICQKFSVDCKLVDIGGGLGVGYFGKETNIELESVSADLQVLIDKFLVNHPNTRFILETGRFLVADSGVYLASVRYVKQSRGQVYALMTGGTNQFYGGASGILRKNFPFQLVSRSSNDEPVETTVCGPLCTPDDVLGAKVPLPPLQKNDVVAILKTGAYGFTFAPQFFLSHPTPAEVLFDQGKFYVIRSRGTYEKLMDTQKDVQLQECVSL